MFFFLESINEHPLQIDYKYPDYEIHTETDIEKAAKLFAKKKKLKYLRYDGLRETYRVYFQKRRRKSLFKHKKDVYIYHVLPNLDTTTKVK
ncbi:hypothetical protein ACFOU2_14585 [Bacillus songklensis]|uniref:Uncharacterized protein n=1 Tax=Bacillus songklensis TaxID=1069116 RepID=A0ABV8B673_9BACI